MIALASIAGEARDDKLNGGSIVAGQAIALMAAKGFPTPVWRVVSQLTGADLANLQRLAERLDAYAGGPIMPQPSTGQTESKAIGDDLWPS